MTVKEIRRLLQETAYPRTGGSQEEKRCATQLANECEALGLTPQWEEFPVELFQTVTARFCIGKTSLACLGYFGSGKGSVRAKLFYLSQNDPILLKRCKRKIVILDGPMSKGLYEKLILCGAVGFVSLCGSCLSSNDDLDQREFCFSPSTQKAIPGVILSIKHAQQLLKKPLPEAELTLDYKTTPGTSQNLLLELPGEIDQWVTVCAHYDSTLFSQGSYDNMSGAVILLALARVFSQEPHKKGLRLLWCGSEERGLLGSLAYCKQHPEQIKTTALNINLDMLGSAMGGFVSFSCADEDTAEVLRSFAKRKRFPTEVRLAIRSSDCVSFAYHNVPSVSFARYAPSGFPPIHTRYDTPELVDPVVLKKDGDYITAFTRFILNDEKVLPRATVNQTIREAVERYAKNKKAFEQ